MGDRPASSIIAVGVKLGDEGGLQRRVGNAAIGCSTLIMRCDMNVYFYCFAIRGLVFTVLIGGMVRVLTGSIFDVYHTKCIYNGVLAATAPLYRIAWI